MRSLLKLYFALSVVSSAFLLAPAAQADTITTFDASGDFGPPAGPPISYISFTGTITIDTTIGQLTAADITLGFQNPAMQITFTGITHTGTNPDGPTDIVLTGPGMDTFSFQPDASDLVNYPGGFLLNASLSPPALGGGDLTPAGPFGYELTPEAAMPEPSSVGFMIAATVLFGMSKRKCQFAYFRSSPGKKKAKEST